MNVCKIDNLYVCICRDENIVIIGSGSAVHNLRGLWSFAGKPTPSFVIDFDKQMEKLACTQIVSYWFIAM